MVAWCVEPHAFWFQNVSSPSSSHSHMIHIRTHIERFNHSLKDGLQTAALEGRGWKEFPKDFLLAYCAVPHATTPCTPTELLHERAMLTKLNISCLSLPPAGKRLTPHQLASYMREKQEKTKQYCDRKRCAKHVSFQCGSYVCVCLTKFVYVNFLYMYISLVNSQVK